MKGKIANSKDFLELMKILQIQHDTKQKQIKMNKKDFLSFKWFPSLFSLRNREINMLIELNTPAEDTLKPLHSPYFNHSHYIDITGNLAFYKNVLSRHIHILYSSYLISTYWTSFCVVFDKFLGTVLT